MARPQDYIYDELLVARCQAGDHGALDELVARFQPRLLRHAFGLCGDPDMAVDLTQEAWLAIVRGINRLDDPASFRSWAFRIVTNKLADRRRQSRRRRQVEDDLTNGISVQPDNDGYTRITDPVREALDRMPTEPRIILALRYLEELSIAEIAEALGLKPGTVKSRLYHARNQLKETIKRQAHD